MVSEQFQMNAGSKCANWKAIIFDVAEKSWKQTSSRRIEKLTWYKNELFSWRCYFNTLITQKGSSNSEMWSSWDSERDGFFENYVVDNRKVCKNRNTRRQQERNLVRKKCQNLVFYDFKQQP